MNKHKLKRHRVSKICQRAVYWSFLLDEAHHEKSCFFLHLRKQRRRSADQCLCFRYINSTTFFHNSELSNLLSSYLAVQPGLCRTNPSKKPQRRVFSRRCSAHQDNTPVKFTPHFYIVKLGFTWVYFFLHLTFALKHRSWVLVRATSLTSQYNNA